MLKENKKMIIALAIILVLIIAGTVLYFTIGLNMIDTYKGISVMDILKEYIIEIAITTIAIIIYYILRYRKNISILKIVLYTCLSIIALQLLTISIFAITRLEVNRLFLPMLMFVYVANIIYLTNKFDKAKK